MHSGLHSSCHSRNGDYNGGGRRRTKKSKFLLSILLLVPFLLLLTSWCLEGPPALLPWSGPHSDTSSWVLHCTPEPESQMCPVSSGCPPPMQRAGALGSSIEEATLGLRTETQSRFLQAVRSAEANQRIRERGRNHVRVAGMVEGNEGGAGTCGGVHPSVGEGAAWQMLFGEVRLRFRKKTLAAEDSEAVCLQTRKKGRRSWLRQLSHEKHLNWRGGEGLKDIMRLIYQPWQAEEGGAENSLSFPRRVADLSNKNTRWTCN